MLSFLRHLLNYQGGSMYKAAQYDEDGNYVDPKVGKLTETELMIPADKARVLFSKSAEDVKKKAKKQIFYMIHQAIKAGKSHIRLETYRVKPDTLAYFTSIGYTIEQVTPPNDNGRGFNPPFIEDEDGNEVTNQPYFYYKLSWGTSESTTPEPTATTGTAVVTAVDQVAGTVTIQTT